MSLLSSCKKCGGTVYPGERIDAYGVYHKGCFRCSEPECGIKLTLKGFHSHQGNPYCEKHVPKATKHSYYGGYASTEDVRQEHQAVGHEEPSRRTERLEPSSMHEEYERPKEIHEHEPEYEKQEPEEHVEPQDEEREPHEQQPAEEIERTHNVQEQEEDVVVEEKE